MSKVELVKYSLESGVAKIYRENATESDLKLRYVSPWPFPYSSVNTGAPCFGISYWDTRALVSNVAGRDLAVQMANEKIGQKIDWGKVDFISTETTAGVPFAAWLAEERKLPLVVVVDKPQPYTKHITDTYYDLSKRRHTLAVCVDECKDYDFVSTVTLEGLAIAAWFAKRTNKPMFYMREEPKAYGKSRDDQIKSQVEGLGSFDMVKGKKVYNIEECLGIQPPTAKRLLSALKADVGEYRKVWGPEHPKQLKGKYGVHFTDLMTSGGNAKKAILALREVGATIDYCHFVIKRGNKDLDEDNIKIGWDLHESEIISIASEQGLFTEADIKQLDEFNAGPRDFNEKLLKTEKGKEWINRIGDRGKKIIVEGYPHLKNEYELI